MQVKVCRAILRIPRETLRTERQEIERRTLAGNQIADQAGGACGLGLAEMAVTEGIDTLADDFERPITGSESGNDGRKPIHSRPPFGLQVPAGSACAFSSIAFERA